MWMTNADWYIFMLRLEIQNPRSIATDGVMSWNVVGHVQYKYTLCLIYKLFVFLGNLGVITNLFKILYYDTKMDLGSRFRKL